jgi:hypothetical protein
MTDIEERVADNGDDGSLIERRLFRRASAKSELHQRPTETVVRIRSSFSKQTGGHSPPLSGLWSGKSCQDVQAEITYVVVFASR